MKILLVFFVVTLFSSQLLISQETGKLDTTITWMGEEREIYYYVPELTGPDVEYGLMIGLHGAGDNAQNYSSVLIDQAEWQTLFPNKIMIFPDGGSDQSADFHFPEGDAEIIDEIINIFSEKYNIAESDIILQGFSLGGRSALKYGLDYPEKFSGLILHTPAIQGPWDAMNEFVEMYKLNYSNANKVPMTVFNGSDDISFLNVTNLLIDSLQANNAILNRIFLNGMGHSITPNNFTQRAIDFIENPFENEYDLEITKILSPFIFMEQEYATGLMFRNIGSETINSLLISVNFGNGSEIFSWTGELEPFHQLELELPPFQANEGVNQINIESLTLNENSDENQDNNTGQFGVKYYPKGNQLPITEDFSGNNFPPSEWKNQLSYGFLSWGASGNYFNNAEPAAVMINSPYFTNNIALKDELISTMYDLSSVENPALNFDIAHNFMHFTPPNVQNERYFADTLEVLISTDGGETYESIYRKWAVELATPGSPLLNPGQQNAFFIPQDENDWRTETINLDDYKDVTNAMFKFSIKSGLGGTTWIDNFELNEFDTSIEEFVAFSKGNIYPNPAFETAYLKYSIGSTGNVKIEMYDLTGNNLGLIQDEYKNAGEHIKTIELNKLYPGAYILKISTPSGEMTEKLIVQ